MIKKRRAFGKLGQEKTLPRNWEIFNLPRRLGKSGQKENLHVNKDVSNLHFFSKKAQEEMVGFSLIIIIVAVLLLIFLGFSLRSPQKDVVESYEVDSFIQAFLQYTTDCEGALEYLSVQRVISECKDNIICLNGKDSCDVLNETLSGLIDESWSVGEDMPVKGYKLKIDSEEKGILLLTKGNETQNYKSSVQEFSKSGSLIQVIFEAYY